MPNHDSSPHFFQKFIGPQPIHLLCEDSTPMHDKLRDYHRHGFGSFSIAMLFMAVTPISFTTRH
ncbi:MAG: hypothetical protein IAF00_01025 [Phycisphaerales bacterium]|nr:hypothetical protein [Phycisphaerales bacterium]